MLQPVFHAAAGRLTPACPPPPPLRPPRAHLSPQVSGERDFFAHMVVEAVTKLDPETLDLRMLGIKKVQVMQGGLTSCQPASQIASRGAGRPVAGARASMRGGGESLEQELSGVWGQRHFVRFPSLPLTPLPCPLPPTGLQGGGLRDSFLVDGVAFKKTFSYAGFEMQPKQYEVSEGAAEGSPPPPPPLPLRPASQCRRCCSCHRRHRCAAARGRDAHLRPRLTGTGWGLPAAPPRCPPCLPEPQDPAAQPGARAEEREGERGGAAGRPQPVPVNRGRR